MELSSANRFRQFTAAERTMIYTGLCETPRVAPDWADDEEFRRLRHECGEAVRESVKEVQGEFNPNQDQAEAPA